MECFDSKQNSNTEIYRKILKNNGITDEIEEVIETSPEDLKGAGTTSRPLYVTVKFKNSNVKPLNLFVKAQTTNESRNIAQKAMKFTEKEVRFLVEYVPAARQFCTKKGFPNLVDFYPKCYYADHDMIVLENLVKDKGYILLSKQEKQGLEAARIALTTLAKHHAISHAFIKEIGGAEEFIKRFPNLNFESYNVNMIHKTLKALVENGIATNITLLEKSDAAGKEEAINMLKAHKEKAFSILMNTINSPLEDERILTLNHGDYWNNNMMFIKDNGTNRLTGQHVILDFQILRYNSPALDIGNFMYTSMKPETRRKHLPELLNLYLDVLRNTANDLGHPIDLTYDELFTILRKKIKYGFWFAIYLAVEIGYAVLSSVDTGNSQGGDFAHKFDKEVQKWINENPEKSKKCAADLVELMKEYSNLVLQ